MLTRYLSPETIRRLQPGSLLIILALSTAVSYYHLGMPKHAGVIHLAHYYLFYLVVIYAAYRYGLPGGVLIAAALSVVYDVRVYAALPVLPHHLIRSLIEIVMMYTVGIVAGYFSGKLKREKRKVEKVSEQLRSSLRALEESVSERIELEKRVARDDRLRVLGQLGAGIAHEIRNPLATIKSGVTMLKKRHGDDELLELINGEVQRLNDFVGRFLQFARFGRSEDAQINMREFAEELESFAGLMLKDHPAVQFDCTVNLPTDTHVRGDRGALKQTLLNLLLNALEAVSSAAEPCITCRFESRNESVVITIADNGDGLKSDPERIFEPFYTTKDAGTGLGLPIAARIAREHGGEIAAATGDDGGAVFTVTLPEDADARTDRRG